MENNKPKIIGFIDVAANTGKVFGNKGAMRTSQKARERREAKQSDQQAEIAEQNAVQARMRAIKYLIDRKYNQK